ncbi:MAG TPA: hypothetical protein VHD91_00200 [Gaiellaceae bacterium]|nr:hypothetical protein [Gaiellaceae bacterium]
MAVLAAATVVRAAPGDPQVVDISKQVADMGKKLNDLTAKGKQAKDGKLAALANCGYGPAQQTFAQWGDPSDYALGPQGDLSTTSGWGLKNVTLVKDHDPYTPGATSLLFSDGGSEAVTPVMCVNLDNPTLRVFLADKGGNGKADLEVDVIYQNLDGGTSKLQVAHLKVNDQWQPSVVIPIGANLLAAASASGWTPVAFDFKVHGLQKNETFTLDGIWVDPCRSR